MAQGAVKKKPSKSEDSKKANPLRQKRGGNRVIAPKKAKLIQKQKLIKKHTAGITALTERNLAEKAGHLELLKGGKNKAKAQGEKK